MDLQILLIDCSYFLFADEKKKTKKVDNELNPVWNEVTSLFYDFVSLDKLCLIAHLWSEVNPSIWKENLCHFTLTPSISLCGPKTAEQFKET